MVDDATAAGERYGRGWHPTTAAGVAPQVGEAFDQSHRLHRLVGAMLLLGGAWMGPKRPVRVNPAGVGSPRKPLPPGDRAGMRLPLWGTGRW
jgi:hypothetical protein